MYFSKFIKAPIILSERNSPDQYSKLIQRLLRYYSRKSSGMIFQTDDACKWYRLSDNIKKEVIPNSLNTQIIDAQIDRSFTDNRIVSCGRLEPQKNYKLMLDAFSKLNAKYDEYNLVIYGEGKLRSSLEKECEKLGIKERVSFPGFSNNIIRDISNAALFVLSSDYEGMPNALMEAMALGLPCVATDCPCGGPRELIKNGENGLLVKVNDPLVIKNAIEVLLSDLPYAKKIGENALRIRNTHNPEIINKQWEKFIGEIIKDHKHGI